MGKRSLGQGNVLHVSVILFTGGRGRVCIPACNGTGGVVCILKCNGAGRSMVCIPACNGTGTGDVYPRMQWDRQMGWHVSQNVMGQAGGRGDVKRAVRCVPHPTGMHPCFFSVRFTESKKEVSIMVIFYTGSR